MEPAVLPGLADLAYAAALDDSLWARWAEEMIAAFKVDGALFWVIDTERAEMSRSAFHFRDVDPQTIGSEYLSGPVQQDPQMRKVLGMTASEIYTDLDHVDLDRAGDREYVAWQNARVGTTHHLTASIVLGDTLRAGIALHTSPELGPTSEAQRKALAHIFPDIARALRLGLRHSELLDEAWWEGAQENRAQAVLLLDEHGRVVRMSPAAERLIAAGDGLVVHENRLCAVQPDCDNRLEAAISDAVRDRDTRAGAMTIVRSSGRKPYQVFAYPMARQRRFLSPFAVAALVYIIDPHATSSPILPAQRELFDLSRREAEVAELLLSGHSASSLAAVLHISPNTARVHIQALLRKTGSNRQSDLVRTLLAGR